MSCSKAVVLCKFCAKEKATYVCPRCNIRYCSSACYKDSSHQQCSETFFKEWVMASLSNQSPYAPDKNKMLDILKRNAEEEVEDASCPSLGSLDARFADINLEDNVDEKVLWDRLTEEERERFKGMLKNENELGDLVPHIKPWWCLRKVKFVSDDTEDLVAERPPLPVDIKSLSTLTKKQPSHCMRFNLVNVLYSYVFLTRMYCNDLREFLEEVVDNFFYLCPVLSKSKNYFSLDEVIQDSFRLAVSPRFDTPLQFVKCVGNDACSVIQGPENAPPYTYVLCALNDLKMLLLDCRKLSKTECSASNKETGKILMHSARKIDFFISWTKEYYLVNLSPIVREIEATLLPEIVDETCSKIESNIASESNVDSITSEPKILIEELN